MSALALSTEYARRVLGPPQGRWTYADWEQLPDDGNRYIIIEVLSPSNADYDRDIKLEAYARPGVPEYAIVDPRTRSISYYRLVTIGQYTEPRQVVEGETLNFASLPTLVLPVAELFAGAPDPTL